MDNEQPARPAGDEQYTARELGGAAYVLPKSPRRWGVVHFGPDDGVCSVDEQGCGYCIGVPCKLPNSKPRAGGK